MASLPEPNIDQRWKPDDLKRIRETLRPAIEDRRSACRTAERRELLVCAGGACISCHSPDAEASFNTALAEAGLEETVRVVNVGCMGLCGEGPLVLVCPDGVYYQRVDAESARRRSRLEAEAPLFARTTEQRPRHPVKGGGAARWLVSLTRRGRIR